MELLNTHRLSPEARSLIERSINWLTPKGRWTTGWGFFKVGNDEITLDEMDDLIDQSFKGLEVEKASGFGAYGPEYEYFELGEKKDEPDKSCLVGSLIINNNYKNDNVFEEAVLFLDTLLDNDHGYCDKESGGYEWCQCSKCEPSVESAIENLVSLNDDKKYSHKRHVLDLFRKAIRRG